MKKKNPTPVIYLILLSILGVAIYKHFHIAGFVMIEPEKLYVCGQLKGMDYTRLVYRHHIATIINLRQPSEHREHNWHNEEITQTKSLGIQYLEIPVEKNQFIPNQAVQSEFLARMADKKNFPVLLHGSRRDNRVAMLVAVWLCQVEKYSAEQAIDMVKMIIDRPLQETEINFVRQLTIEKHP
jgi:protein tyrosine phosphatase (PTP) superfamily phosphohydrolase (DUF442 family)